MSRKCRCLQGVRIGWLSTCRRETTSYLLLSHVYDLSGSPEIRRDPPTATPVASTRSYHQSIAWPRRQWHSQRAAPRVPDTNGKGANSDKGDTMMLPLCIPACGCLTCKKKAVFLKLRNPSFSMDHALSFVFLFFLLFSLRGMHQHANCNESNFFLMTSSSAL